MPDQKDYEEYNFDRSWSKLLRKYRLKKNKFVTLILRNAHDLITKLRKRTKIIFISVLFFLIVALSTSYVYVKITQVQTETVLVQAKAQKTHSEAYKTRVEANKIKSEADVQADKTRAEADKTRAEANKIKSEADVQADKTRAEVDKTRAETNKIKSEGFRQKATSIASTVLVGLIAVNNKLIINAVAAPIGKLTQKIKNVLPFYSANKVEISKDDSFKSLKTQKISNNHLLQISDSVKDQSMTSNWSDHKNAVISGSLKENKLLEESTIQEEYSFYDKIRYMNFPNENDKLNRRISQKSPWVTNVPVRKNWNNEDNSDLDLRNYKQHQNRVLRIASTSATVSGAVKVSYVSENAWENGEYDDQTYRNYDLTIAPDNYQTKENIQLVEQAAKNQHLLGEDDLQKTQNE